MERTSKERPENPYRPDSPWFPNSRDGLEYRERASSDVEYVYRDVANPSGYFVSRRKRVTEYTDRGKFVEYTDWEIHDSFAEARARCKRDAKAEASQ